MKWILRFWILITIVVVVFLVLNFLDKKTSLKYEISEPGIGINSEDGFKGMEELLKKSINDNIFLIKFFFIYSIGTLGILFFALLKLFK